VTDKNVNCSQCYALANDAGSSYIPDCKTSYGCPIGEELAADPVINDYLTAWMRAKALQEFTQIPELYFKALQELELDKDLDLLLELERIWNTSKERARAQSQHQRRARSLI